MSDKKELALVDAEVLTTEEKTELNAEIDRFIEAHKANRKEINRLVFESVAAMTEADEAGAQLSNKGFFRRMIGGLTGSNQKLQNKINQSRAAAQYASQQTLQKLAEQNLMSFDLITAVNNKLNASMQSVGEGFQLIFTGLEKFFKQSRNEMVRLEMRLARVERNVKLLTWQSSVEYLEFEGEEYQEMDDARKIVCLVRDFYDITQGEYTTSDLLLLKAAMAAIDIAPKKPVNYGQVIAEIAADSALQEKLLGGAGLKPIKDPSYLISMGSLQKLDALHNEESYMVSTVERYLNRTGSDIPRETICHDLASDYMKEKAGVNLDLEVESFDMMLDLLYALKQVEEEHLLGKPKDASLAEAGEVLAAWKDAPSENKKELFSKVLQLAEAGDAAAQFEAGKAYYNGEGAEQDYEEAVKWYRKAAEQGNATAQRNLGICYDYGNGVEQDDEEAVKWYRKAAGQG